MMPVEQRFIRYLLGEMNSEELVAFEDEYFSDASVFASLCQAERDLLDLYSHGGLPAPLRDRVALGYGATAERRAKISMAAATAGRGRRLFRPMFRAPYRGAGTRLLATAVFAAVACLAGCAVLWTRNEELRSKLSALTAEPAIAAPTATGALVIAEIALQPGLSRSDEGSKGRDLIRPNAAAIRLALRLPGQPTHHHYQVSVWTAAGEEVWMQSRVPAEPVAGQTSVVVLVPAAAVPDSDYLVRLRGKSGVRGYADIASYALTISRAHAGR